ncbi:MAG: GNAT family N-acetyltransferase [Acidimicrobiales bacterium]
MTAHPPNDARLVLPAEAAQAADVLARAFHDDPVLNWLFAGADDVVAAIDSFFPIAIASGLTRGHLYRSPGWEAVAYWSPPGAHGMFNPEHAPSVGELVVGAIGPERAAATGQLSEILAEHHLTEAHFYLPFIGVAPEWQGRGYGKVVMQPVLDLCDHHRLPAYLESSNPRNIPFYERLGFRVTAEFAADGGPPMAGMRRDPAN